MAFFAAASARSTSGLPAPLKELSTSDVRMVASRPKSRALSGSALMPASACWRVSRDFCGVEISTLAAIALILSSSGLPSGERADLVSHAGFCHLVVERGRDSAHEVVLQIEQ